MSLVITGTMAFDSLETPFGKVDHTVGGSATYAALAATNFMPDTKVISIVGDDFPETMFETLKERGVATNGVEICKGEKSFYWSGKYHLDMNTRDTLVTDLNVLEKFNPIVPNDYQDGTFLMVGNLMPELQLQVIEQFKEKPKLVILDTMDFWMNTAWDDLLEVIKHVDVLVVNDSEVRQLTQEVSLVKAAQKVKQLGCPYVVIKKGEHGALLFHDDQIFFAPALPLEEVIDPTGAGDTFAGGFIGYLASVGEVNFENMKTAIIAGTATASFCVEKFGTDRLLEISQKDIFARIEKLAELVNFENITV